MNKFITISFVTLALFVAVSAQAGVSVRFNFVGGRPAPAPVAAPVYIPAPVAPPVPVSLPYGNRIGNTLQIQSPWSGGIVNADVPRDSVLYDSQTGQAFRVP